MERGSLVEYDRKFAKKLAAVTNDKSWSLSLGNAAPLMRFYEGSKYFSNPQSTTTFVNVNRMDITAYDVGSSSS